MAPLDARWGVFSWKTQQAKETEAENPTEHSHFLSSVQVVMILTVMAASSGKPSNWLLHFS